MALLVALAMTVIAILSAVSLAFSWVTRRDMRKILSAFEKGHHYSDPSAAAVVTPSPVPSDAEPALPEPSHARVALSPTAPRSGGVSRPFRPSPEQIATARAAHAEVAPRSGVASTIVKSESPAEMRARIEAEEDALDRERVRRNAAANEAAARAVAAVDGLDVEDVRATLEIAQEDLPPSEVEPSPGDRESDATHVFDAGARRTVFGMASLDGVKLEAPESSPSRTANAFRMVFPDSPTLVSAGITPPELALEGAVALTPEELARVDVVAREQGVSRKTMLARLLAKGSGVTRANDAAPAPLAEDLPRETASVPPPVEPPMDLREKRAAEAKDIADKAKKMAKWAQRNAESKGAVPRQSGNAALDAAVELRWHALIAAAQEAGKPAHHCRNVRCTAAGCACQCDGCALIAKILIEAQREALGK